MRTEGCREWRESLGAYVLGQLGAEERARVGAHLEGCSPCREEARSLAPLARLLPHADPARFGSTPQLPPALGARIAAKIGAERRTRRRRRASLALAPVAATVLLAAALAALMRPGGGEEAPAEHVTFPSMPPGMKIGATLEPHAYGTEIHVYVKGAPSGALCRVFLRGRDGSRLPAGSFRYRWDEDSQAVLSSALDLARTRAIGVRVGRRTYIAPLGPADAT